MTRCIAFLMLVLVVMLPLPAFAQDSAPMEAREKAVAALFDNGKSPASVTALIELVHTLGTAKDAGKIEDPIGVASALIQREMDLVTARAMLVSATKYWPKIAEQDWAKALASSTVVGTVQPALTVYDETGKKIVPNRIDFITRLWSEEARSAGIATIEVTAEIQATNKDTGKDAGKNGAQRSEKLGPFVLMPSTSTVPFTSDVLEGAKSAKVILTFNPKMIDGKNGTPFSRTFNYVVKRKAILGVPDGVNDDAGWIARDLRSFWDDNSHNKGDVVPAKKKAPSRTQAG